MRFKCIEDYDVAKKGQIWILDDYRDVPSKVVTLRYKTERCTFFLNVNKEKFVEHFMFLGF